MGFDDPRVQTAVFGALGPAAVAFVCTAMAWLVFRAISKKKDTTTPDPRAAIGPALGVGLAFALSSLGLDEVPERMPVGASDWVLPVVLAATLAATIGGLLGSGKKGHAAVWLTRALVVALVLVGPLSRPRANYWEGTEVYLWMGGVALWMLLAFAASDRTASRSSPVAYALVLMATAGGLVPVIFGAGVTAQSQIAGGVAAALGGVLVFSLIARTSLPALQPLGTVVIAWITMMLAVSWQFVSDMAWWELGVVASIPIAVALVDVLPGVSKLSAFKRLSARLVLVVGMTAAVSGHHVPDLINELTGGASDDPYGDYLEGL